MIPSSILTAEKELRRAIERRREGDISKCISAYAEIAEREVQPLHPGDPVRLKICERVLSVLKWATLMLQTRRAVLAEELRLLQNVDRFLDAKPSAGLRFHLDL